MYDLASSCSSSEIENYNWKGKRPVKEVVQEMNLSWSPLPRFLEEHLQSHAFIPPFTNFSLIKKLPRLVKDQLTGHASVIKGAIILLSLLFAILAALYWTGQVSSATASWSVFLVAIGGRLSLYAAGLFYAFAIYRMKMLP